MAGRNLGKVLSYRGANEMAGYHRVQQGEHVSRIAAKYGFSSFKSIWNHPNNADLKAARQTPNVLLPGDTLFIPDRETRVEAKPTDQRHRFVVHRDPLILILVLKDNDYQAISNSKCELQVESACSEMTTDGTGLLQERIGSQDENGRLVITQTEMDLRIGDLNPFDSTTGHRARLNNLGYKAGTVEGEVDPEQFRSAVEEFQCDHHLTVDGVCGPVTQAKLKAVYGC
jgi:hypothetical protein